MFYNPVESFRYIFDFPFQFLVFPFIFPSFFLKPSGLAYFICMKESEGCRVTLSVKYDIENMDAEPTITR